MSFFGFSLIRDDEVGIVTKNMFGASMRPGQIIATNGEVGVQADTLLPGLYWYMPFIWSVRKTKVVNIEPGTVGIVESIDGKPLQAGRLLGDEVECNSFQDGKAFLEGNGRKGAQVAILRPGKYRINTELFKLKASAATVVAKGMVGMAIAQDGISLPSGFIISPAPRGDTQHFQNGQAFIDLGGHRGSQLETLQPGEYYINPLLFEIITEDIATIPPGYVAVIISSVGRDLERGEVPPSITTDPGLHQLPNEPGETPLITDKEERGILKDPVAPGSYNLNTLAYRTEFVPTSAITIDWASNISERESNLMERGMGEESRSAEFFRFSQLKVTSKDGFQLEVDVRLIIRIPPMNAPAVIARFGTVNNLIEQVAHPLIDSSFRNEAGGKAAMEFVHSRKSLQETALQNAKREFAQYHVEVQGLLIAYIKVDEKLLETQTKKEIAVQQQKQYDEEANAQEKRIAVMEKTARADKQPDVIKAKLSIDIATDTAEAARKEAEGIRDATKTKADGSAYEAQRVGEGTAAAYSAQVEAIGKENVAALKLIEQIAAGKVVITPQVLVEGGSGDGGNTMNLLGAILAKKLAADSKEPESTEKRKPSK